MSKVERGILSYNEPVSLRDYSAGVEFLRALADHAPDELPLAADGRSFQHNRLIDLWNG